MLRPSQPVYAIIQMRQLDPVSVNDGNKNNAGKRDSFKFVCSGNRVIEETRFQIRIIYILYIFEKRLQNYSSQNEDIIL